MTTLPTPARLLSLTESKAITARRHATEPLTIYNYTDKTAFEGLWDDDTRQCRGLIIHDNGTVIARPYQKFFNLGEPNADLPVSFRVFDKADGSLGVTYRDSEGKVCLSTRGSFESEQAKHATRLWRAKYDHIDIPAGQTWLFEIVYPANRIVLSYGGMDDLILHGAVDIATGADLPIPANWPGPVIEEFPFSSPEGLVALNRQNAEGYVLREDPLPADRPARRVKVKLAEYVRLHKLISGMTPKSIWAVLSTGQDLDATLAGLPDEFHKEAMALAAGLRGAHSSILEMVYTEWAVIQKDLGAADRKTYAAAITARPRDTQAPLFALLSGRDPAPIAWKQIEPRGGDPS